MPDLAPVVFRPVRIAVLLLAVLAVYFGCFAPLIDGFCVLVFLKIGLPYCLFLALFAVGFLLASRSRVVWFWIISGTVPSLGMVGLSLAFWLAPFDFLRAVRFATIVMLILIGLWLGVGGMVAG